MKRKLWVKWHSSTESGEAYVDKRDLGIRVKAEWDSLSEWEQIKRIQQPLRKILPGKGAVAVCWTW